MLAAGARGQGARRAEPSIGEPELGTRACLGEIDPKVLIAGPSRMQPLILLKHY